MKKTLIALTLLSGSSLLVAAGFRAEDQAELNRISAELKAAETQLNQVQNKIAQLREAHSRKHSAAHVNAADSVKKTYENDSMN